MDETLSAWFAREVLPHEAALMRYLRRVCRTQEDAADIRQEVYIKIYESARQQRPNPVRTILFTIARNLLVDRIRRNRIVSIEPTGDVDSLNVLIDELTPERRVNARQELRQLGVAFGLLPQKCREVLWLRKVDQIPQAKVAEMLNISVRTVEFHVQKGMRILADNVFGEDGEPRALEMASLQGRGSEDGQ